MIELLVIAGVGFLLLKSGAITMPTLGSSVVSPAQQVAAQSQPVQAAVAAVESGVSSPPPTEAKVAAELDQLFGIQLDPNVPIFDTLPGAGSVTMANAPATTGYVPLAGLSTDEDAAKGAKLASMAVGMTASVGAAVIGAAGGAAAGGAVGGLAAALATIAPAIPFVGIALAVVSTVIACIEKHHEAALLAEHAALASALPIAYESLILIAQGVIVGEITSVAEANMYSKTVIDDFYTAVKSVQRGTWPYTLTTSEDPSVLAGVGVNGPGDPSPGAIPWYGSEGGEGSISGAVNSTAPGETSAQKAPNPCNGPCGFGHYYVERGAAIVELTVAAILAGEHGIMTLIVVCTIALVHISPGKLSI